MGYRPKWDMGQNGTSKKSKFFNLLTPLFDIIKLFRKVLEKLFYGNDSR